MPDAQGDSTDPAATEIAKPGGSADPTAIRADLARESLARARAASRNRPTATSSAPPMRIGGRDPASVDVVLRDWIRSEGYEQEATSAALIARWPDIAGADVAAHTVPEGIRTTEAGREVLVRAESTAWATQLTLLSATLLERIRQSLGPAAVDRIRVVGPAPPPRSGPRRVPGRGPRDTYG